MGGLWGGSRRVICQKNILAGNYGNRPLWRSIKKKKRVRPERMGSRIEPKGTILAGQVVIDCQYDYL